MKQYETMEAVPMEWFQQKRALNVTVDGPILKRWAEETALKLSTEFRPSSGWVHRFTKYSGLVYRKVYAEADSVNPEEVVA
jgi:hypothetical protein